jgi:hypothetical protein
MPDDPMNNATAVGGARDAAVDSLMDDVDGDTARADEVFTQLAIENRFLGLGESKMPHVDAKRRQVAA